MSDLNVADDSTQTVKEILEALPKLQAASRAAIESRHHARFNSENQTIDLFPDGSDGAKYEIGLETIHSSADVMKWLRQLRSKKWFRPEVENDFLSVFFSAHSQLIDGDFSTFDQWNWQIAKSN